MSGKAGIERREVHFSGYVQGVGFRYTTRNIAGRFCVDGFVQNLDDGRVLLVVEGECQELQRFIDAVSAEMDRYIADVQSVRTAATGEFVDFSLRF